MPTAKLTPEYERRLVTKLDNIEKGIEFDNLSNCAPPGHPRWMTEPFLREFVVTPDQTYLINEMVNDIRRIYTDGREHIPEGDRYPLWNGDSIGFWDGGKLVIHTNSLRSGQYQRTDRARCLWRAGLGVTRNGKTGRRVLECTFIALFQCVSKRPIIVIM